MKTNDNQGGNRMTQGQQTHDAEPHNQAITIRPAAAGDTATVQRLAELDSAPSPAGKVLLAVHGNEAVAAIELDSGSVIADPFRWTADVAAMLVMRRRALAGPPERTPWWRRLRTRSDKAAASPDLAMTGA